MNAGPVENLLERLPRRDECRDDDDGGQAALYTGCIYVAEHMDVRERPSRDFAGARGHGMKFKLR